MPAANPSAVFQETDSICPPTRWVAIASAPNSATILVSTMEIIQYTIPCIAVGPPILQMFPSSSLENGSKKADSFEYIFFFFRTEYSDHHHKHNDKLCADRRNSLLLPLQSSETVLLLRSKEDLITG